MGSSICTMIDVASEADDVETEDRQSEDISDHEKLAKATVYHNDYLMRKIIEYVPPFQDRLKLDLVSLRFQELVRQTKWTTLDRSFEILEVYAPSSTSAVRIKFGKLDKNIKLGEKDCSYKLMTMLWKLLVSSKNVKTVIYGSQEISPDNNGTLVLNRELMKHAENFVHLKTLVLKNSDVDQGAIDYLTSDECVFKLKIENLIVKNVRFGPWILHLINEKLQTLCIQIYDLSVASALVQKLDQLDLHLEKIDVRISVSRNSEDEQEIQVLNGLSNRCTVLSLAFYDNLKLAKNINHWTNITVLTIDTTSHRHLVDLPGILNGIKDLTKLQQLTISERINRAGFISLTEGIKDLTKLKYLKVTDRASDKEFGIVESFFGMLPLSLEEIELDNFIWEAGSIEKICEKSFRKLTKLTIRRPDRRGVEATEMFHKLISAFRSLERFYFLDATIETNMVNHVIEHPNLNDVRINVWNEPPMEMVTQLRNKFKVYRCVITSNDITIELNNG